MPVRSSFAAVVLALAVPAAHADDLQALRQEIAQMKQSYERRIAALEARLAAAEARAGTDAPAAATEVIEAAQATQVPAAAASRAASGEAAFNPAISVILDGTYTRLGRDPNTYAIAGFMPAGGETGPARRGFGLGESELSLGANVDTLLRGQLTFSLPPEGGGANVEEAYVAAPGLGGGFTLKAGRFLSGVGYLNQQHPHAWDFADAPLAYRAMFGGRLGNDGVQLKWLAPTDLFVELGAEAAAGGPFPSTDRNKNGGTLGTLFAHAGGDVGISNSWRAGLSLVGTSPRDRRYDDLNAAGEPVTNAFAGRSRTWIGDFVWKWAPEGNATARGLTLQGEVFRRRETGQLAGDATGADMTGDYAATQSGYYAQAVYQFMPRWRLGYRHDRLDSGKVSLGGTLNPLDLPALAAWTPRRDTLMVDWSPSEFSRLRLQFARDQARRAAPDNQLWLQYVVGLGAHGAHNF